jgi:hypothetical protein
MTPPTTAPVAAFAVRFSVQAEVVSASTPAKAKAKYFTFIVFNSCYPMLLQMERSNRLKSFTVSVLVSIQCVCWFLSYR